MDEESYFVLSSLSYRVVSTEVSIKLDNIMQIPSVLSSFHTVKSVLVLTHREGLKTPSTELTHSPSCHCLIPTGQFVKQGIALQDNKTRL